MKWALTIIMLAITIISCDTGQQEATMADIAVLPSNLNCDEVDDYIKSKNIILPTTYDYVSVMPEVFAKAAIRNINSVQRLALWQDRVRATHIDLNLNASEREVIDYFLSMKGGLQNDDIMDDLIARIEKYIERDKAYIMFASLSSSKKRISHLHVDSVDAITSSGNDCSCSNSEDFCNILGLTDFVCIRGGCDRVLSDCGWFWRLTCTGKCGLQDEEVIG